MCRPGRGHYGGFCSETLSLGSLTKERCRESSWFGLVQFPVSAWRLERVVEVLQAIGTWNVELDAGLEGVRYACE